MTAEIGELNLRDELSRLERGPDSVPWQERLELARSLREPLSTGVSNDMYMSLLTRLAADPKWEVRATIASLLPYVNGPTYVALVEMLRGDTNSYVQSGVQRALGKRRKVDDADVKSRRSADQVHQQRLAIERDHGKQAALQALRMSERYSELLVGSMVHDLRSIATFLKTNCETLIRESTSESPSKAKNRRLGASVRADVEFLERAIEDMATFTRPVPTQRRSERLAILTTEALKLARDNVEKLKFDIQPVTVLVEVPDSISVEVARHQIVMAFANLLKNAYESFVTPSGQLREGEIRISAALAGDAVKITVRDNGMGMTDEEIKEPQILTPGRRNKTKRQSTGYGLPIAVRNIVAHEGSLAIESQKDNGTTITMTLPLRAWKQDTRNLGE